MIKRQIGVLHPENILAMKSLDMAFDAAIKCEQWERAIEYGTKLAPVLKWVLWNYWLWNFFLIIFSFFSNRKHTLEYNPLIGLIYMKIGKIQKHLQNYSDAIDNLKAAGEVLKITHGEESALYKEHEALVQQAQQENSELQARRLREAMGSDDEDEEDDEEDQ